MEMIMPEQNITENKGTVSTECSARENTEDISLELLRSINEKLDILLASQNR